MKYNISIDKKRGYRCIVSLADRNIFNKTVCHYGSNKQQLEKLAKTQFADELYRKIPEAVFCSFKNSSDINKGITLSTVLKIYQEDLKNNLKGSKALLKDFDILESLCTQLSNKDLSDVTTPDCQNAISYVAENSLNADDKIKLENKCRQLLVIIFGFCTSTGLIQDNPARILKAQKNVDAFVVNRMKIRSLTEKQEKNILDIATAKIDDSHYFGLLLMLLTGLYSREICALKFGDLMSIDILKKRMPTGEFTTPRLGKDYVLSISRKYMKYGNQFIMTQILEKQERRIIPISNQCRQMIEKRCSYLVQAYGLSEKELAVLPMVPVTNKDITSLAKNCKPDNLGRFIKETLIEYRIQQEDLYLPLENTKGENDYKSTQLPVNTRLLRSNFEFNAKNVCGLTLGEIDYLLGRKTKDVDSKHYREFREYYNLLAIKQKLNRWEINETCFNETEGLTPHGGQQVIKDKNYSISALPNTDKCRTEVYIDIEIPAGFQVDLDFSCYKGFSGSITINNEEETPVCQAPGITTD